MSRTIPELMADDHAKIKGLLTEFKEKQDMTSFESFEWELQKHLFVEEKAIFTMPVYDPEMDMDYSKFRELIGEHEELLEMMDTIRQELRSGTNMEINDFLKFFEEHMEFEEVEIYPKLEEELSNKQKRRIVYKITNSF